MLQGPNKDRARIKSDVLKELMQRNGYTNKSLADEISVSESAVKKWTTGRNSPNDYAIIEKLASIFNIEVGKLIEVIPSNTKAEDLTNADKEEIELLTWPEIRKELRRRLLLRGYLEFFVDTFFAVHMSYLEKVRIFLFKKDGSEELQRAISAILQWIDLEKPKEWYGRGNWITGIGQKRMVRRTIKYVGIDLGFLVAYLRYAERYRMQIKDIFNLVCGVTNINEDFLDVFYGFLSWYREDVLKHSLPVINDESVSEFCAYGLNKTINAKSMVIPLFLTPYGESRFTRTKAMYDFINGNGLKTYISAKYFNDDNLQTIIRSVKSNRDCVLLMYDDLFGGDEVLKNSVEAYAAENNIRICYLNPSDYLYEV